LVRNARLHPPFFDVESDEFKELDFQRGWSKVAQSNEAYVQELAMALLEAKYGNVKTLSDMCEDPVEEVEYACRPVQ